MDYKAASHKAYLKQQRLEMTPENIKDFSIHDSQLRLLFETLRCWVVLNDGGLEGAWLNMIWKGDGFHERQMETIEL